MTLWHEQVQSTPDLIEYLLNHPLNCLHHQSVLNLLVKCQLPFVAQTLKHFEGTEDECFQSVSHAQ